MLEEKERTPVVVIARSHARACWWVVRHGCCKERWRMQCFVEQPRKTDLRVRAYLFLSRAGRE
jgi:hypothetical protein